jgi:hypothetical protein
MGRLRCAGAVVLVGLAAACVPVMSPGSHPIDVSPAIPGGQPGSPTGYASAGVVSSVLGSKTVLATLDDGSSYCEYHAFYGEPQPFTTSGWTGSPASRLAGNWQVESGSGQVCYSYPGTHQYCLYVVVYGSAIDFYDANGVFFATGEVSQGNQC